MARRRKLDPDAELDPDQLEELEEENDSILRDGQSVRVSLFMKDGAINPNLLPHQKAKAAQQTEDAVARRFGLTDALQLHRPGFRRNTDAAALERVRQAYNDAEAADANAWKATTPAKLECVPDRRATADTKAQAYADYDREMADAWRSK